MAKGRDVYPGDLPDIPFEGYRRVTIDCSKDGVTQQSFKDDCDINKIVERSKNQMVTHVNMRAPVYRDATQIPDYHSAMNIVVKAEEAFMQLDARVRERFENDPGKMLKFMSKEDNFDECVKLGLFKPRDNAPGDPGASGAKDGPASAQDAQDGKK